MSWIVPVKRSTLSKSTRFSKYSTVEESEHFLLQKRKLNQPSTGTHSPPQNASAPSGSLASSGAEEISSPAAPQAVKNVRPAWRIVTKGTFPYYEVAYGFSADPSSNEPLLSREWRYITQELPSLLPPHLPQKDRNKWFLAHFTQLAIENTNPLTQPKSPSEGKSRRWPFRSKRKTNGESIVLGGSIVGGLKSSAGSDPEINSGEEAKSGTGSPAGDSQPAPNQSSLPVPSNPAASAPQNSPAFALPAAAGAPQNNSDQEDYFDPEAEDDYSNEHENENELTEGEFSQDVKEDEGDEEEAELDSEVEAEYFQPPMDLQMQAQHSVAHALYQSSMAAAAAAKSARIASTAAVTLQQQRSQQLRLKWQAEQFNVEAQKLNLKEGFIFGEPEALRGTGVFVGLAILMNFLFLLIRDASLNSFLLFAFLMNATLFYLVIKGKPVSLAIHVQQNMADIERIAQRNPQPASFQQPSQPEPLKRSISEEKGDLSLSLAPRPQTPQARAAVGADPASPSSLSPGAPGFSAPPDSPTAAIIPPLDFSDASNPRPAAIASSAALSKEFVVSGSNSLMVLPAAFAGFKKKIMPFTTTSRFDNLSPGVTPPPASWGTMAGSGFSVRVGPNYRKNKLKALSGPSMYECIGIDTFQCDQKVDNIGQIIQLPIPIDPATGVYEDSSWTEYGAPELILIQFQIPSYDPGYVWSKRDDGEGFSLLAYYKMTDQTKRELKNNSTAAAGLLKKFLAELTTGGDENHGRFKAIPRVANPESPVLGRAMKSLLKTYNAKPFLTGPFAHGFIRARGYLEIDIDVHRFCFMARKAAFSLLECLKSLLIDVAFVVEGTSDEELPEQILGAARLNFFDPKSAKNIRDLLQAAQLDK